MKVPLEWLRDYVDIKVKEEVLAEALTMAGIAVEGIEEVEGDKVLELELTPNRGDCQGLVNVAREVSAILGGELHLPPHSPEEGDEKTEDYVNVIIETDLCRRYSARLVKNVRVAPSPLWMQKRLLRAGVRPINNVVDVTNYVMLEMNQPLHAFDFERLKGGKIIVRQAKRGERLTTLDGVTRELTEDMMVIADEVDPQALAGIMGGAFSEISENTTTVLLESANFDPVSIRKTSRRLNIRTESSLRFEKGVDVEGTCLALDRAVRLLEILGAGETLQGVVDVYPVPREARIISLEGDKVNRILGTDLGREEIAGYLERLRFEVRENKDTLEVKVPSYRLDIEMEEDLVEEIARIHGYDKIPVEPRASVLTHGYKDPYQRFCDRLGEQASGWLRQVITYSFINPKWFDVLGVPEEHVLRKGLKLSNPLSEEQSIMRTTLIPGLLEVAAKNAFRRNQDLGIFELGNVFFPKGDALPEEVLTFGGMVVGTAPRGWSSSREEMDFYYLKGIVEGIFRGMRVEEVSFIPFTPEHTYHPHRVAKIVGPKGEELGVIGEIHPRVMADVGIKSRACAFEMKVSLLYMASNLRPRAQEISRFPAVERDLAFVVDEDIPAAELIHLVREAGGQVLKKVEVFDVYRSPQLGENKKSIALSLTFQSMAETLQDEEVAKLVEVIVEKAGAKLGARLR